MRMQPSLSQQKAFKRHKLATEETDYSYVPSDIIS